MRRCAQSAGGQLPRSALAGATPLKPAEQGRAITVGFGSLAAQDGIRRVPSGLGRLSRLGLDSRGQNDPSPIPRSKRHKSKQWRRKAKNQACNARLQQNRAARTDNQQSGKAGLSDAVSSRQTLDAKPARGADPSFRAFLGAPKKTSRKLGFECGGP